MLNRLGPLGKYGLIIFIATRMGDVIMMLYRLVLGKALSPADFGAIDPILKVVGILGIPIGIAAAVAVKMISRLGAGGTDPRQTAFVRDMMKVALIGAVVMFLTIVGLRDYILERLHITSATFIWLIAGLAMTELLVSFGMSIIQGGQRFKTLALLGPITPFLMLTATVGLVWWAGFGLAGAVGARIAAGVVALCVLAVLLRHYLKGPRASYRSELGVARDTAISLGVYALGLRMLQDFDCLFVRNYWQEHSGGYGALITFGQIPVWLVGSLIMVLFPMVSAEHAAGRDVRKLLKQALGFGAGMTVLCAAGFWVIAEPLFKWWNPAFVPYAKYLWLFAIAFGFHGIIAIIANYEIARQRYSTLFWLVLPAAGYCALVYSLRGMMTLELLIYSTIAVRVVVLAGMSARIWVMEKKPETLDLRP